MTAAIDCALEAGLYRFGQEVLKILPDMFERGITFPVTEDDERRFLETLNLKAIREFTYSVHDFAAEHRGKARRKNLKLALSMSGHDLNNLVGIFGTICSAYSNRKVVNLPEHFFRNYTNYRTLVLTMADLGLGGAPAYVTEIPVSQLEYLLYQGRINLKVTTTIPESRTITSREYVSLYQLVQNVPPVPERKVSVEIEVYRNKGGSLLVVRDNGPGILDQEDKPISAERLPEIFGEYSTKKAGGGWGLQLVKALVELPTLCRRGTEKGYVSVSTKSEGGPASFYSTSDGISRTLERELTPGTEFKLHFNR